MAIVSGPKNGTSASEYGRLSRALDGPDQVTSGLQVTFFANRTVRVAAGAGRVGGFGFVNTSTVDFTSDLETSVNPRVDRLVARLPAPGADVVFAIVKGAAASTPALPALTQVDGGVWEFGLGYWLVPGNSGGTIPNGKVWGHYADDGHRYATDSTANISTGNTALILAMSDTQFAGSQFAVPGAAKVQLDVTVSCYAQVACGGTLILQMAGKSQTVNWKASQPGPFVVTAPPLVAGISAFGGQVPAIVQMAVEGALNAAAPLFVVRIDPHQFQVMP